MEFETRKRHTIMDGSVYMYATGFTEEKGIGGPRYEPTGPFEVSASRNAVIVHHADCRSKEAAIALSRAIEKATAQAAMLAREDHGGFRTLTGGSEQYANPDNLIDRLRGCITDENGFLPLGEAADALEAKDAEIERLTADPRHHRSLLRGIGGNMNFEEIERHVERAHKVKRGLRGHFTPAEYNENWQILRLLLAVARAAHGLSFGEDWNNGSHALLGGYRQQLLDAIAELEAHCKEGT